VKFVLVDPKSRAYTFNKIEKTLFSQTPDMDDAIITDNAKVVNTLNSLCRNGQYIHY
jgi:S-DNA-T family DNA segregation ATPase FtsK/SpoIIIE